MSTDALAISNTSVSLAGAANVWDEKQSFDLDRTGDSTAEWTLVCRRIDLPTVANTILGGWTTVGGLPRYNYPLAYPDAPWLYGSHIHTEPIPVNGMFAGPQGLGWTQYVRCLCTFRSLDYDIALQGNLSYEYGAQVYSPPTGQSGNSGYVWNTGTNTGKNVLQGVAPGILISVVNFTRTLEDQFQLPNLANVANTISSAPFFGYSAGNVMFTSATSSCRAAYGGNLIYRAGVSFSFRNVAPWDYFFDPDIGTWNQVKRADGTPLLTQYDYNGLFPFE